MRILMGNIKNFLIELDDYELAYFIKFKFLSYTTSTQSKIKSFLIEKEFDESQIDQLILQNPKSKLNDGKERCPRCYSNKLRSNKVEWTNTDQEVGFEEEIATSDGVFGKVTYKNEVICNVCGFWLEDPNLEKPQSIFKRITNNFFGFLTGFFQN